MKAIRISLMFIMSGVLLMYSNCGGSKTPAESISDQQLGKLTKTWKVTSVNHQDSDVTTTADYQDMTLTLTGTKGGTVFTYAVANKPGSPALSPWKSGGSWSFGVDPITDINRDPGTADALDVGYVVTASTLQVNFIFTGNGYQANERVEEVGGSWVFTFAAQ